MSADNIIYIKKHRRKWRVWEQSASCDPKLDKRAESYDTMDAAIDAANKMEEEIGFVEYWVNLL